MAIQSKKKWELQMLSLLLTVFVIGPLALLFESEGDDSGRNEEEPDEVGNLPVNINDTELTDIFAEISSLGLNEYEVPTDIVHVDADDETTSGGAGSELIIGTDGDDHIFGFGEENSAENDVGERDTILAGAGNDVVVGSTSEDLILGGVGDDTLFGGRGADTLLGGEGNDSLIGVETNWDGYHDIDEADILDGGDGDDTIVVGNEDLAIGGEGRDSFILAGHESIISDFDISQDILVLELPDNTTQDQIDRIRSSLRLENVVGEDAPAVSLFIEGDPNPIAFIDGLVANDLTTDMLQFLVDGKFL